MIGLAEWVLAYWWLLLLEGLVAAGVIGVLALSAHKIVGGEPRSLGALKASMAVTAVATVAAYIGLIVGVSLYLGATGEYIVYMAFALSAGILLLQWLFSPYIIGAVYRTRDPATPREVALAGYVRRLAEASGLGNIKVKIAEVSMPNAFAYGSPLAGSYVAVTRGLLRILDDGELRAVAAHEVGHLKHRDVSWILALAIIPLAVYFIGRMLVYAGFLGGGNRREGSNPLFLLAVGAALIAASIVFRFLVAHFNRLREYYADAHSALSTGSPRMLQRALAKIYVAIREGRSVEAPTLAAPLFIVAPLVEVQGGFFAPVDRIDVLVEELKRREESPIIELFSTHPPIAKRLRFLDRLAAMLRGA